MSQLNVSSGYIFSFVLWQHCAYCLVRLSHKNHLVWVSRQHVVTWIPVCHHEHGGDVPTSHPTHPDTNRKTVTLSKCWSSVSDCGLWLGSIFTYKTFVISHQTENWMSSSNSVPRLKMCSSWIQHFDTFLSRKQHFLLLLLPKNLTSTKDKMIYCYS